MLSCWLTSSLIRIYPATRPLVRGSLSMDVARNEFFSCQVAVRRDDPAGVTQPDPATVKVVVEAGSPWNARVRRVGYVPMRHANTWKPDGEIDGREHIPGFVPDPLFEENALWMRSGETHSFWISLRPVRPVKAGRHTVRICVTGEGDGAPHVLNLRVRVHPVMIRPRRDFSVIHWFYNDSLLDFHHCDAFDKRYWSVLPNYLRNLAEHGQDTVYVPVFTPPLDGVKRPTQLLRVTETKPGRYSFDWRDVRKYIATARACGIRRFEWTHLFTQWGARHALRIYHGQGLDKRVLWPPETPATGPVYRDFLRQFLPAFARFLRRGNLMDRSFFHLSDEPHDAEQQANYRAARELLRELAPWMRVMDALSDATFARQKLVDTPVCTISGVDEFIGQGMPVWCYFCCQPRERYLNRMLDDSLAKIRMSGWLFHRWPLKGFLHWGYNFWYAPGSQKRIDPFQTSDGENWPGWPHGDPFLVYPGSDGPLDSIRWEVFAESLQDYALLQSLKVRRDDRRLARLRSFKDFPKTEKWINRTRNALLAADAG